MKITRYYIMNRVFGMDTRTGERWPRGEYHTRQEAEEEKNMLDERCKKIRCDHHRHWIEE